MNTKNSCVDFLFLTEGTDVVVNSIADSVWGSEDEITVALSDEVKSWYWPYLFILPMSFPMANIRTNNMNWWYYLKTILKQKSKFGKIQIINTMMYVTIVFKTPI